MDEIKDLIKIVTDHTRRNLPLLDLKNLHQNGNKEANLFLGISEKIIAIGFSFPTRMAFR